MSGLEAVSFRLSFFSILTNKSVSRFLSIGVSSLSSMAMMVDAEAAVEPETEPDTVTGRHNKGMVETDQEPDGPVRGGEGESRPVRSSMLLGCCGSDLGADPRARLVADREPSKDNRLSRT